MSSIVYLIVRQYANRIKRLFRKPLAAVFTLLVGLCVISGPVLMFFVPQLYIGIVGEEGREIVIAGIQLFIGVTLIVSSLSQQGGLFTYSEANLLFSSPLSKRTILLYSTLQSLPASILTSLMICFYLPYVIGGDMSGLKFLISLLVMSLMIFCIYILYYYIYIQDIGHPGLKAHLRKAAWLVFAAVAAVFAIVFYQKNFDMEVAAVAFFTSPIYNAVPVFGWAKWSIASLLNNRYLNGFLPATLLLAAAAWVLARMYYSLKVDFFEKAQLDSIRLQQVMDNMKKGGYDASALTVKKVRKTKGEFRPGAAALMSRQFLEMKKKGPLLTMKELINGAIYIVIGLAAGLEFGVVFGMLLFAMIASTTSDAWNADMKKPYIFLIPESPFRKLVYAILPGLLKTMLAGAVTLVAAALLFGLGFADALGYLLILLSYILLFEASGAFAYRLLGKLTNAILLMFLRMLFVMLTAVPGGVAAIILSEMMGTPSLPAAAAAILSVNMVFSLCLLFLSRKMLEQAELAN